MEMIDSPVASTTNPFAYALQERRSRPRYPLNFVFESAHDILQMRTLLNQAGPWNWSCKRYGDVGYCIESLVTESQSQRQIRISGDHLGRGPKFFLSLGYWGDSPREVKIRQGIEQQLLSNILPVLGADNIRVARQVDFP
jgi:hypothetical protein